MDHLDDCPVCKAIVAGEIEKSSKHCCLVVLGKLRLAVLKTHEEIATPLALTEAVSLLQGPASGYVSEYSDFPGHWALCLINTGEMPTGSSKGK